MDIKESLRQDIYRRLGISPKVEEPKEPPKSNKNKKRKTKKKSPSIKNVRFEKT